MPAIVGVFGLGMPPGSPDDGISLHSSLRDGGDVENGSWRAPPARTSIGAGFFIDGSGTVVTAWHVVAGAEQVLVKCADESVQLATVIGHDEDLDVAVLRVPGLRADLPPLGRSVQARPGDWVLAVGEPFGLQRSVVAGIVSGRPRHFSEDSDASFIQTDLALNPGNSGGPLLDASGRIVGMNLRAIVGPYGAAGVSLSIPIETVLQVADELQSGNSRQRPRLDVGYEDVSALAAFEAGRSHNRGALVTNVAGSGLGHALGLQVGDIVVGMNEHAIGDSADFTRRLLAWRSVAGTRLVIWRDGRYQTLRRP